MTPPDPATKSDGPTQREGLRLRLRELAGSEEEGKSARERPGDLVNRLKKASGSAAEGTRKVSARLPLPVAAQRRLHIQSEPTPDPADHVAGDQAPDDETWTLALSIGTYLVAASIATLTTGDRGVKMKRVVDKLRSSLTQLAAEGELGSSELEAIFVNLVSEWPEADRIRLLIDLNFGEPFFPYSLKVKPADFEQALRSIATLSGFGRDVIGEIQATRASAQRAHSSMNWVKIGIFGAGGVVLVGTGAFALAPIIGSAIGGAAGLSGAAATSYGMAFLGGGSLASGGAGMAGGLWLVTGAGAAAGLLGGSGSAAIFELGAKQVRVELTRLQVTMKMTMLTGQVDLLKAQSVLRSLEEQRGALQTTLDEEQLLNDERSTRIKDLNDKLDALADAIGWIEDEEVADA